MRRRRRLFGVLLVAGLALGGAVLVVHADELLFGPPTGGGVATIPFDATQAAGCVAWDGVTMITHPTNPLCEGGGGSTSPQPTQTPWGCGPGYYVEGLAGAPTCVLAPTPDGAGGASPFPTPTGMAFRAGGNNFTGTQDVTGDLAVTAGNVDLTCTSVGCAVADLTSGDQVVFERGGFYGNMALHSLTGGVVVADRWHTDPAACPSGQFCIDTDVTGACVCQALSIPTPTPTLSPTPTVTVTTTATPTLSPTPTPTATLAAGNAIDLTAGVIDFDPTELTNFTVSDGLSATATTSYNLSGADDPTWKAKNHAFELGATDPELQINDNDIVDGTSPDFDLALSCTAGPSCQVLASYQSNSGGQYQLWSGDTTGNVRLGGPSDATATLMADGAVTITSNSVSGTGALVVPNDAITLGTETVGNYAAGDAEAGGATKVTGSTTLPATCTEKDLYQDTDSGGTEFYVCTATDTWTKAVAPTDVPAYETDPTVPLLSLADLGDLCAANEGVVRNSSDTANICLPLATSAPTATPTPTATNTASPMPISTASPGLAGSVLGTSLTMARADHVHALPDSSVTAGTYTNANITVNSKGLITAAADGSELRAAAALFVDLTGTDFAECSGGTNDGVTCTVNSQCPGGACSGGCGPINAPCRSVGGALGAQQKILMANDNGFATCTLDQTQGAGACFGGSLTATCSVLADCSTGAQSCTSGRCVYPCNQDSDCTGGGTCTAQRCQENASKPCVTAGDCSLTCATTNDNGRCPANGPATGPSLVYRIDVGAGQYDGDYVPVSPGSIAYHGSGQTYIVGVSSGCVFDVSSTTGVSSYDIAYVNNGSGDALCSNGATVGFNAVNNSFSSIGTSSWAVDFRGFGNSTSTFVDNLYYSPNGFHFQPAPKHCSLNVNRACNADAMCTTGVNDGTCVSGTDSGDLSVQGGQIQSYGANGFAGDGSTLLWFDGIACGASWNMFVEDIAINGESLADTGQLMRGAKVSVSTCDPNTWPIMRDRNRVLFKSLRLTGTDNPFNYGAMESIDIPLDVSDSDSSIGWMGPITYDACRRRLYDRTSIQYERTGEWGGGLADLGVLNCPEPNMSQPYEWWGSKNANATATVTPTATATAVTPTPTATRTVAPTASATNATPTPTVSPTAIPQGLRIALPPGGTTVGNVVTADGVTATDGGTVTLKTLNGTAWLTLDHDPASFGTSVWKATSEFLEIRNTNGIVLGCGGGFTAKCTVNADPTTALGIATKQYVDARAAKIRTSNSTANTSGTLGDDTVLKSFAVAASTTYLVEGDLYVITTGAGDDMKLAFQGASGDTCSILSANMAQDAAAQAPQRMTDCDNAPTSVAPNLQSGDNFVHFSGYFTANAGGTLDLQFAVNVAGSTTLGTGSWMRVSQVQ